MLSESVFFDVAIWTSLRDLSPRPPLTEGMTHADSLETNPNHWFHTELQSETMLSQISRLCPQCVFVRIQNHVICRTCQRTSVMVNAIRSLWLWLTGWYYRSLSNDVITDYLTIAKCSIIVDVWGCCEMGTLFSHRSRNWWWIMLDQLDCFQMQQIILIDLFMTWQSDAKLLINLDIDPYHRIALNRIIAHYIAKMAITQAPT